MKKKTISLNNAQTRINEIQALYREWILLLPKLKNARQDWQHGTVIMQKLADFYFGGEYLHYKQAIDDGLDVDLQTKGEYSIMSEDTLWDAFYEQQTLAWQQLRSAIAVLDKEGEAQAVISE